MRIPKGLKTVLVLVPERGVGSGVDLVDGR
jgi:hypothetical protein